MHVLGGRSSSSWCRRRRRPSDLSPTGKACISPPRILAAPRGLFFIMDLALRFMGTRWNWSWSRPGRYLGCLLAVWKGFGALQPGPRSSHFVSASDSGLGASLRLVDGRTDGRLPGWPQYLRPVSQNSRGSGLTKLIPSCIDERWWRQRQQHTHQPVCTLDVTDPFPNFSRYVDFTHS